MFRNQWLVSCNWQVFQNKEANFCSLPAVCHQRMHVYNYYQYLLTCNVIGGSRLTFEHVCDYRPAWWRSMSSASWTWSQLWGRGTTLCRNSTCSCTAKTCSICSYTLARTHTVSERQLALIMYICISNYGDHTLIYVLYNQTSKTTNQARNLIVGGL